jgi:hypothetical protein
VLSSIDAITAVEDALMLKDIFRLDSRGYSIAYDEPTVGRAVVALTTYANKRRQCRSFEETLSIGPRSLCYILKE